MTSRKRLISLMIGLFAAVHAFYWLLGLRFDSSTLNWYMQFLDPALLRTRLLESVFYLHSQPPLYNLFLGLTLKAAAGHEIAAFWAIYLGWGLTFYLALFALLRRLGVRRSLALALSTLFMASPPFVLYEHWLFYTFPLALLVTASALLLLEALRRGGFWRWTAFFAALVVIAATRSLFHLAYLAVIAAGLALVWRRERRQIALAALIPFALLFGLYAKNLALFGKFTSSTWMGMSLWTMTARNLPAAERERLVAQGAISAVSLVDRFADPENYPPAYFQVKRFPDVPVLSVLKKGSGFPNYNHQGYIALSEQYLADALAVLRLAPRTFVTGSLRAWFSYFRAGSDNLFLLPAHRAALAIPEAFYDTVFFGKLPFDLTDIPGLPIYTDSKGHYVYLFLVFGLPLLALYGLWRAWRGPAEPATRLVILFLCFNILYVAFIGNALETGENNRFRFMTDGASLVLLGLGLEQIAARRRKRTRM
jgi:hypothetical protein